MNSSLISSFLPLLLALIFMLSGCGQPAPSSSASGEQASASNPQGVATSQGQATNQGQTLFITHCASCHQSLSQPPGPNAVILNSKTLADVSSFKALLRQPISPMMPAFGPETISDDDAQKLYTYLHQAQQQATPE